LTPEEVKKNSPGASNHSDKAGTSKFLAPNKKIKTEKAPNLGAQSGSRNGNHDYLRK
jgi:hypothetical protein